MIDLNSIKARLASADPRDWKTYTAMCQAVFVANQREDMFTLIAEVERLQKENQALVRAIESHNENVCDKFDAQLHEALSNA